MPWADAAHAPGQSIAQREISQCGEVLVGGKEHRLEASHLAGRCRSFRNGTTADNPAHRRITSQAVGVVHVFVATEAAKDRLTKQSRQRVLAVLAGARVNQLIANHVRQPECVIEFTVGKQSSVGSDFGTVKLKLEPTVKIQPQNSIF